MKRSASDGLIGMWFHTFDEGGDIDRQLEVIRRSGSDYICRNYSWEHGRPCGCAVVPRNTILQLPLYESSQALNAAMERHFAERRCSQIIADNVVSLDKRRAF